MAELESEKETISSYWQSRAERDKKALDDRIRHRQWLLEQIEWNKQYRARNASSLTDALNRSRNEEERNKALAWASSQDDWLDQDLAWNEEQLRKIEERM